MNNLVKLLQCVEEEIPPPEGERHILHLHQDDKLMLGIKVAGQWCKIELSNEDVKHYKTFAKNTRKQIEKIKDG